MLFSLLFHSTILIQNWIHFLYLTRKWSRDWEQNYVGKQTLKCWTNSLRFLNFFSKADLVLDVYQSVYCDIIIKVTNKMQIYRLIHYSKSALHVSGNVFAHHQKHLTYLQYPVVFTQVAAGWCPGSSRDTSRQQRGWTLPDTVNTVKCS
jgi:hypothetical protein